MIKQLMNKLVTININEEGRNKRFSTCNGLASTNRNHCAMDMCGTTTATRNSISFKIKPHRKHRAETLDTTQFTDRSIICCPYLPFIFQSNLEKDHRSVWKHKFYTLI